jgi:hypothetical protein
MKLREVILKESNSVREADPAAPGQPNAVKAAGAVQAATGADDKQAAQKTASGSKMAANAMGAKGGSGAMMQKGLDKLGSGGAMTGALSKQIAPFAKQLTNILGNQQLRQKFMMLVKQAEKTAPAAAPQEAMDKDEYKDKQKALQDIQMDPNTSKDPELKKELMRKKAQLQKEKPVDEESDAIIQLAKLVSGAGNTQMDQASNYQEEMMRLAGITRESATAGATSAGSIASVANPLQAKGQRPKDKNGLPKAPQKKKADGTAENALDLKDNFFGGKTVKR